MAISSYNLPVKWAASVLGEVCLVNPRSFTEPVADDTEVSFVPMAAVEAETGRLDSSWVRPFGEVSKGYTKFSDGDVLFAKITPCMENGKIAVARGLTSGFGCGSTEFHVLRPLGGLAEGFVMYFLLKEAFRKEAQGNMTGSAGQLRVPAKYLGDAPFPLPPLAEQHRIVAEIEKQLTRLDASVAALRRARANLKRYRASVLKDACEGRLVPTEASLARAEGREYEHAGQLLQRILEERRIQWESQEKRRGAYKEPVTPDASALPELPEGWVWATVEHLSYRIQYGTSSKASSEPIGVPILRMGNIQDGRLDTSDLKYLPSDDITATQTLLKYGDLLFNRTNSAELVGKCAVFKDEIPSASFASYLIRVAFNDGLVPEFACFYISSVFGRRYIGSVVTQQVGQANVNGSKLGAMPLPLPPFAEQIRIIAEVERRLSVVQQTEVAVDANLRRAERLRQSVLKRAFEGKLAPQDPNDEPASVLLERIRAERDAAEASETQRGAGRRGRGRASKREEQA